MSAAMRAGARAATRRQRGRTIVETMVSVSIGLAILLALVALYGTSSRGARNASATASVEFSGNILLTLLGDAVKAAGYGEIVSSDFGAGAGQTLFDGAALLGCRNGRFAAPAAGDFNCVAAGGNDALMVSFQAESVRGAPQGALRDCLGAAAPAVPFNGFGMASGQVRPLVVNSYGVDAQARLECFGNGAGQAQALIEEVEQFKVFYGFDAAGYALAGAVSAAPSASAWVDADWLRAQPAALRAWDFVVSVQVCLRVRSRESGAPPEGGYTIAVCPDTADQAAGTAAAPTQTFTDGRLRRVLAQTFTIRSQATDNPLVGIVP